MRDTETPAQGEGIVSSSRRPRDETARLGMELYELDIRPQVENDHPGKSSPSTWTAGSWAVANGEIAVVDRLRELRPDAVNVLCERVGYRALRSFGARSLRRTG